MTVFVCGGARSARAGEHALRLSGPRANLELRIAGLPSSVARRIPPAFVDLVELACHVEAADAIAAREAGRARRLQLVVPVRAGDRYREPSVFVPLARTLGFLSGDEWRLEARAHRGGDLARHLEDEGVDLGERRSVEVIPFSGGLDSFAGALRLVRAGRPVVLVAHRSSPRLEPHVRKLAAWLAEQAPEGRVSFVSTFLRRDVPGDPSPRTRAFVWAAVAGAIAAAYGARSSVRFFENGVVALGLPLSAAGLDARVSRGTHPRVLAGLKRVFSELAGRTLGVENGLLWSTKAEVVQQILAEDGAARIADTVSCSARAKRPHTHCGLCAQCIDRRFATLAAGASPSDPSALYEVDLLTGDRPAGEPRAVLESYVRAAAEIAAVSDDEFFARHGELARVLAHLPGSADEVATKIVALHRRHAAEIERVLDVGIREHATALRRGTLPRGSLLVLALPREPPSSDRAPVTTREHERREPPPGAVRILHLSDLHFSPRRQWDQDPVLRALADDVAGLVRSGLPLDFVAITGDVADRGSAEEYGLAARFLREHLLPSAGVPPERLLLVPGNHDVDRGQVGRVAQAAQADLVRGESQDAIAAVLGDPRERAPLLRRHDAWLAFVRDLGAPGGEVPWWSARFSVRGIELHVAGLCSTWSSWCDEDKGRLLIGRAQLHRVLERAERADLCVALVHHPWDYLPDFDAAEVREAVQRRCHVLLRGHLHKGEGSVRVRPDGGALELASGASWGGSKHPHGYQLVELEPSAQRARVHLRTWDGHDWIADRNAYRGAAPDGVAEFPLRARAG